MQAVLAAFHPRAGAATALRRCLGGGPAGRRMLLSPGIVNTVDGLLRYVFAFIDERRPFVPLSSKRFAKVKRTMQPHLVRAKTGWSAFMCTVRRWSVWVEGRGARTVADCPFPCSW